MCPSAWATVGMSATRRTVHRRAQRTAIVFAPPRSRRPARRDEGWREQVGTGKDQQAVRPGRRRARRSHVREVRGAAATELRRRSRPTDPNVPARWKFRFGDNANTTTGAKGVDPPGYLGHGNQRASVAAEGAGCHSDAALNVRSASCDDPGPATAIECAERDPAGRERRDEKAIAEAADGVDRDAGGDPCGKIHKPAAPAAPIDANDPGVASGSSAKTTSLPKAQPAPRTRRPVPRAMYDSPGEPA